MEKTILKLVSQPQDYFRELILEALKHQNVSIQPETEYYLGNLLFQFIKTDYLYYIDVTTGKVKEEPLAFLLKEALEESQSRVQAALFRYIGDLSLYKAGFFQESFNRKLVDIDYYIQMGSFAYRKVEDRSKGEGLKDVYHELSTKFSIFIDVLSEISEKTCKKTKQDLLKMYELWLNTKSERVAKVLKKAGIFPNETLKKAYQ